MLVQTTLEIAVRTESATLTVDDFPGLEPGAEVEVEFRASRGSSDFFAGGCWHPGDPPELELGTAYATEGETSVVDGVSYYGQFSPWGAWAEWLEQYVYEHWPDDDGEDYYED